MNVFNILSLLGGLALFLYGMKVMGDSLSKMAGSKLAEVLERLAGNTFSAVLLGTAVTTIIQSSSATTVMVVGFVNSGIMNLKQAIGIIMGANIGTTATSWLLSLSGIEGDVWWLNMLKPATLVSIFALAGIIIHSIKKESDKWQSIAAIFFGFSILMLGMETMSGAVAPLAESESFGQLLIAFSNPIMGILAGAIFTAIIQSSSASVGILQAFCLTGLVNLSSAIPIIMGQNIGTCGTALISSIGASKNAKRASMMHLMFNLIGTLLFMVGFYLLHAFVDFEFLSHSASPADIAIIHSLFNIGSTIALFPFANQIVRLVKRLIPDNDNVPALDGKADLPRIHLDERFLQKPGFGLEIAAKNTSNMADEVELLTAEIMRLLLAGYDKSNAGRLKALDNHIKEYKDKLEAYLLELSKNTLSSDDAEKLVILQHTINDLEDIADYDRALLKDVKRIKKKELSFSDTMKADFERLINDTYGIVADSIKAFKENDLKRAKQIEEIEEGIHSYKKALKKHFLKQIQKGHIELELGMIFENILIKLDRIAAHCTSISLTIIDVEG